MQERVPSQYGNEDEPLFEDAGRVVNALWEKATGMSDLVLREDLHYRAWMEDLSKRKNSFAKVLFARARETSGEKKLHAAKTLQRLMKLIDNASRRKILEELLTTEETVLELVHQAERQTKQKSATLQQTKTKFQKTISRLLGYNDDFDNDI